MNRQNTGHVHIHSLKPYNVSYPALCDTYLLDCVHTQCTSALSSGFPISQGNAEALDSWGGKTKHHMISYFLGNTSAKNYRNRIVYVKIIASRRWDVFWDMVYFKSNRQSVQIMI